VQVEGVFSNFSRMILIQPYPDYHWIMIGRCTISHPPTTAGSLIHDPNRNLELVCFGSNRNRTTPRSTAPALSSNQAANPAAPPRQTTAKLAGNAPNPISSAQTTNCDYLRDADKKAKRTMANLLPSRQGRGLAAAMADAASADQHRREIAEAPLEHRGVTGCNLRSKHQAAIPIPPEGPERPPER
jgi:hypothetical protein